MVTGSNIYMQTTFLFVSGRISVRNRIMSALGELTTISEYFESIPELICRFSPRLIRVTSTRADGCNHRAYPATDYRFIFQTINHSNNVYMRKITIFLLNKMELICAMLVNVRRIAFGVEAANVITEM